MSIHPHPHPQRLACLESQIFDTTGEKETSGNSVLEQGDEAPYYDISSSMVFRLCTSQALYPMPANNGTIGRASHIRQSRKTPPPVCLESCLRFCPPCTTFPFCPEVSSPRRIVRAKRFSSPVGSSGAKKRCGRSHDPSSSRLGFFMGEAGSMSIASGSRSSPSSMSTSIPGDLAVALIGPGSGDVCDAAVDKEGMPKIGFCAPTIGLLESVRVARRSGSGIAGVASREEFDGVAENCRR